MSSLPIAQLVASLVEGIGLVLSPCILPILPIMLAGSLDGGKARPIGIIIGFIAAFTFFAILSREILEWLHVDPEIVRNTALVLLVLFGIVMLSKTLSDKMLGATQGLANLGQNLATRWNTGHGFSSGLAIGGLIGLIWTPCAGPIMAAAIVQIIQAKTNVAAALTVFMFALGAGIPMLVIALVGRSIMNRLTFLKTHSYAVRRVLGILIIAAALLIYSGADIDLLAASAGHTAPQADASNPPTQTTTTPVPAPEFGGIKAWINSPPLALHALLGKVVLVDFWTYSCINCVRTLPTLTSWDAAYRDKGLVIIGVHAPEFDFEKNLDNVKAAVAKHGIHYPVALDNDLVTWGNFQDQYWPAQYLINQTGQIVYTHFGEGEEEKTENQIRSLLGLTPQTASIPSSEVSIPQTPETYLGYGRAQNFASNEMAAKDSDGRYTFPTTLENDNWALDGDWLIGADSITAQQAKDKIRIKFTAHKVYAVLGTSDGSPLTVHVLLNKHSPSIHTAGKDLKDGVLTVDHQGLYQLIDESTGDASILELDADGPGLQAYTFTFGN